MENHAPTNLEDQPLNSLKSTFNVPERADEEAEVDSSEPLSKRLENEKGPPVGRKGAYKELAELFEAAASGEDTSPFSEYGPRVRTILLDKASLCHENALLAAAAFASAAPVETVLTEAKAIAAAVIEKHGSSPRRAQAIEVLLRLIEAGSISVVQPVLVAAATHKVPKVCGAAVKALTQALRAFGPTVVEVGAIVPVLVGIAEHRDKAVREERDALVGELRLIKGDAFPSTIKGLAQGRAKALQEVPLPDPAGPTERRALRGQGVDKASTEVEAAASDASLVAPKEEAAFDLYGALRKAHPDPKAKAGATGSADKWTQALKSEKWQEKKNAAELISTLLAECTKLVPADYTEVAKGLKSLLSNTNLNVVAAAIRAMGALALPLGKDFGSHAKRLAPELFNKGSVKNTQVVEAVKSTLETFASGCLVLEEALDVAKAAADDKNVLVQECAARFVRACAAKTEAATLAKQLTPLKDLLLPLTDGSSADVRSSAFEAFASACGVLEPEAASAWLDVLPEKKSARVRQLLGQKAPSPSIQKTPAPTPSCGPMISQGPSAPANADITPPVEQAAGADKEKKLNSTSAIRRPAPSKPLGKPNDLKSSSSLPSIGRRPGGPKGPNAPVGGPGGKQKVANAGEEAWNEPALPTLEELPMHVDTEGIPAIEARSMLAEKPWAKRIEGIKGLGEQLKNLGEDRKSPLVAELALEQLSRTAAGEKIVQVLVQVMELTCTIASSFPLIARRSAARAIKCAVERLGVKQTKQPASDALTALGEACGPSWVLGRVRDVATGHKNPKVLLDALQWAKACIEAFGVASPTEPLTFALAAADSRDAAVRDASLHLMVAVRLALGPAMLNSPHLNGLGDHMKERLKAESDKLATSKAEAPPPTKRFKHGPQGSAPSAAPPAAALDALLPRVDLMSKLPSDVCKRLNSKDQWKERKEALDEVLSALKEHPRIAPGVGTLIDAIRPRLKDNQVAIILAAIHALGALAPAVGKLIKTHLRAAMPNIIHALGDGKQQVRDAALETLDKWVGEVAFEPILPLLHGGLAMEAPVGRAKLLAWIARFIPALSPKDDKQQLLLPVLKALDDRTKEAIWPP